MNTLHLSLKKKWYDMIEKDRKTEEYHEIKEEAVQHLLNGGTFEWTTFDNKMEAKCHKTRLYE